MKQIIFLIFYYYYYYYFFFVMEFFIFILLTLLFNFLSLYEGTSVQNFRYIAKYFAHNENFAILAKISL